MRDKSFSQHECRKYLPAFADGELDVEQNLLVLEQMAMDPENCRRVMHQQQLRKAVQRALAADCPNCPEGLKERVAALWEAELVGEVSDARAAAAPRDTGTRAEAGNGGAVIAKIGRWFPAAVAAVLLVAAAGVYFSAAGAGGGAGESQWVNTQLVSASLASELTGRHDVCSRNPSAMKDGFPMPDSVEQLPGAIEHYLDGQTVGRIPELNIFGYEFVRAGNCPIPGDKAVHLVYQGVGDAAGKRLSLWIANVPNAHGLEPGRLYTAAAGGDAAILTWYADGHAFYLVGDEYRAVDQAAATLVKQR